MSRLRKKVLVFLDNVGDQSGCHRNPDRSFFYKGRQFPVCARCTGVAIGQLTAIIVSFFMNIKVAVSCVCLLIMGTDWSIQELGLKESTNVRRFFTGILGGFGFFSLYCTCIKRFFSLFKNK